MTYRSQTVLVSRGIISAASDMYGLSHDGVACFAHAFLQIWGSHTLSAVIAQPTHRTPKGPPCLVPGKSTKPSACRSFCVILSVSSYFPLSSGPRHCAAISTHFPDKLWSLLWSMCLIISFQSQEEERSGSQFRTIILTGETVCSLLPRGKRC